MNDETRSSVPSPHFETPHSIAPDNPHLVDGAGPKVLIEFVIVIVKSAKPYPFPLNLK